MGALDDRPTTPLSAELFRMTIIALPRDKPIV